MSYELHSFVNEKIEFEYSTYQNNDINPILELYRGKLFCYIIKEFINKATSLLGTKIFSIKKSFPRTLTNLLSSWMFTLYASEKFDPSIDPFLPNNYDETESIKNILKDLVKYDDKLTNVDKSIDQICSFLSKIFSEQLINLNNYKNSSYYNEKKNKYTVYKKNVKQKRNDESYDFYKYEIKIDFELKDKRLVNILDNLLIPEDEYKKLFNNYSGKKNLIDNYIWIILFRYQLLGSNNHQLGVKNDIMVKMSQDYDLNFECFASSINCTFNKYCSIYYDVENYFGSVGSFYNLIPKRGTFGMNPPYQKNIIETALRNALKFLSDAENNNDELSFIITIPIWDKEGKKQFNNDLPQQNIDYGDFEVIKEVQDSKYHKITRKIAKENFTYVDHNFKLFKNKTIQNTYVIIVSTKQNINTECLQNYDFN